MNNPMNNPEQIAPLQQSTTEPIERRLSSLFHSKSAKLALVAGLVIGPTVLESIPASDSIPTAVSDTLGLGRAEMAEAYLGNDCGRASISNDYYQKDFFASFDEFLLHYNGGNWDAYYQTYVDKVVHVDSPIQIVIQGGFIDSVPYGSDGTVYVEVLDANNVVIDSANLVEPSSCTTTTTAPTTTQAPPPPTTSKPTVPPTTVAPPPTTHAPTTTQSPPPATTAPPTTTHAPTTTSTEAPTTTTTMAPTTTAEITTTAEVPITITTTIETTTTQLPPTTAEIVIPPDTTTDTTTIPNPESNQPNTEKGNTPILPFVFIGIGGVAIAVATEETIRRRRN